MSAHHLHDEGALMRIRRAHDGINSLDNSMQRRIGTDSHVSTAKIIVNRSDHAGNVQHSVFLALVIGDTTGRQQLVQQTAPFLPEQVCTSQRTVATNYHLQTIGMNESDHRLKNIRVYQIRNSFLHQIAGSRKASLALTKIRATRRPNDGATTMNNAGHWRPVGVLDVVAAIDHALVALTNEVNLKHEYMIFT